MKLIVLHTNGEHRKLDVVHFILHGDGDLDFITRDNYEKWRSDGLVTYDAYESYQSDDIEDLQILDDSIVED